MTDYHEPIHHVMDRDGSLGLMNVIYAMACENRDTARDFIKTHSNLTDADIDDFYAALDSNDPEARAACEPKAVATGVSRKLTAAASLGSNCVGVCHYSLRCRASPIPARSPSPMPTRHHRGSRRRSRSDTSRR
jgi:hypothetical protein